VWGLYVSGEAETARHEGPAPRLSEDAQTSAAGRGTRRLGGDHHLGAQGDHDLNLIEGVGNDKRGVPFARPAGRGAV